ncbi:MAG: AAA family ATPase [Coriobacteriales bacterium]|nr:AAA family ATPase [Coriobacteriales bacterium]
MDNLFSKLEQDALDSVAPLAVRMRPTTLDELLGQSAVLGAGTWLRGAIEADTLSSIILFGPAGSGKTTLARIIARQSLAHFTEVSAISGGVSDLRRVIGEAAKRLSVEATRTILFVDEIHRFSRSQQDALLHAVEDRTVVLIGATTENPAFEVNTALLSRSRVIEFRALSADTIRRIVARALTDPRGLNGAFDITEAALGAIATLAAGDARSALSTLEMAAEVRQAHEQSQGVREQDQKKQEQAQKARPASLAQQPDTAAQQTKEARTAQAQQSKADQAVQAREVPFEPATKNQSMLSIDLKDVLEATPRAVLPYDKQGDIHYDVISAFIKSMRGSNPDAAVYWLARMLEGGEDPKFIARRIMIFASEDIGNADPQALLIAHAAFAAVERIGLPECQLNLSQACIYMALAPKSNASYLAIAQARQEVRSGSLRPVPNHLRDRHRPGSENYEPYLYPHLEPSGYAHQHYLPDGLDATFFVAGERGWEAYRSELRQQDSERAAAEASQAKESANVPKKPDTNKTA